ncbi:hypothetical protein [Microvirga pudoricolor]|uniref:hypothetical protein n=1 Tax=Microvirga pudoricolor TaxID=2778729 RepID=UPI00194DF6C9|nr:hypothetical protein [Microvirga pudoricolor]MBM6595538.1 hypothetical protein [Microvirga pudoricolor]
MIPTRKLYTSELDLADEDIPAFAEWYAYRHAPDIFQAGFDNATSYRAVEGDMSIFDLYEIESVDLFERTEYKHIPAADVYSQAVLARRRNKTWTIYSHVFVAPVVVEDRPLLNSDWIAVERFDLNPSSGEDVIAFLNSGAAERLLLAGAKRVRLATRTKGHPRLPSFRPHYLLLSEWPNRPDMTDLRRSLSERFGTELSDQTNFVGYRMYPWPDKRRDV